MLIEFDQADGFHQVVQATAFTLAAPGYDTDAVPTPSGLPDSPVIRDEAHLEAFIWDTFRIRISKACACRDQGIPGHEHHVSPWEAFTYAYFAKGPICLWKASRGFGGKSFMLSLLTVVEAITLQATVKVLGGSEDQSVNVLRHSADLWAAGLDVQQYLKGQPGSTETKLVWNNSIEALTASPKAVRGPHPQRLRLDEFDEAKIKIVEAAQGMPLSKGWVKSQTVFSSTHHYPDGTFTHFKRVAADRGWPIFEWCMAPDTLVDTATGPQRIDTLKAGDRIWSFTGDGFELQSANDVWLSGRRQTIRVVTTDGEVECTPEHRICTTKGWVRAGDLQPGDGIVTGHGVRMPAAEATAVEDVPALLSAGDGQAEPVPARCADDGQGDGPHGDAAVVAGSAGGRVAGGAGPDLYNEVQGGAIRGGFLPARTSNGRGSLRAAAQEVSGERGQGHHPGASDRGCGLPVRDPVRPGSALVVEIRPGRDIDVWDLSLPAHHAFLANGHVVHNCYRENLQSVGGFIPDEEIGRKQIEIGSRMWAVEYEGQEPSAEGRAFDSDAVQRMFRKPDELVLTVNGVLVELGYLEEPVAGATYAHGGDWARKVDFTVLPSLRRDVNPLKLVAIERFQKRPWPATYGRYDDRLARYGGSGLHDATGLGDVIDAHIRSHNSAPFIFQGRDRADLLSEYVNGVEKDQVVVSWPEPLDDSEPAKAIRVMKDEHLYATVDDLYSSQKANHLPDTIAAMALAYRAATIPEAAGAVQLPDDGGPLVHGIQRGRMSVFNRRPG